MFDKTWLWAGKFRLSGKNIGGDWTQISTELHKLCADVSYQIQENTMLYYEIAARFHHRLVWIHAFPNGNGRHARLMTDLLLSKLDVQPFNWGQTNHLVNASHARTHYIKSLKIADRGDISELLKFARA